MAERKFVWTVATGAINPFHKKSREAVDLIKGMDGFVAVHPCPPHGTLWLFDSKNNAKAARNRMEFSGIQTGDNICRGRIEGDTLQIEGVDND